MTLRIESGNVSFSRIKYVVVCFLTKYLLFSVPMKILLGLWTLFPPKLGLKYLSIWTKTSSSNLFRLSTKTGSKLLATRGKAWLSKEKRIPKRIPKTLLIFKVLWVDFQIWKSWFSNTRFFGSLRNLRLYLLTSGTYNTYIGTWL